MQMPQSPHFPPGVIIATVTPMDHNLNPDLHLLVAHCKSLLAQGGNGIVLLGTTGEANSFSVDERKHILEAAIDAGISPEVLMVGTGCCALTDTLSLTKHATTLGVKNVLMLPPFYYKPVSDDALFNYYAHVVENTEHDGLHIYLYHIPQNTGIPLSVNLISRLLQQYPGIVTGIKDSGGDWNHIRMLIRDFPSLRVYSGSEEYLLDTLKTGGVGCISATANVTISFAVKVVEAFKSGRSADEHQETLTSLRQTFKGFPFVGALKGFLGHTSQNSSWNNLRPPNEILDDAVVLSLVEQFTQRTSRALS